MICRGCNAPLPARNTTYCSRKCYRDGMTGIRYQNVCEHGYSRRRCHVCRKQRDARMYPDRYLCRICGGMKRDHRSRVCCRCKSEAQIKFRRIVMHGTVCHA